MGICNAPATFQRAMNVTFHNFVKKTKLTQGIINFCVIVYMDDILVYSESFHGHAQHIEWTLGALQDAGFKIALEKKLGFYLEDVVFHWAEPAPEAKGGEVQDDEVELLIVQAWRTDTEGELLGILFGKVEKGHLGAITNELLVFLAQLVDDLPLEIPSRCDEKPGPNVLTRTHAPHLLWSTCTELDGDNCLYTSLSLYLEIGVTDLTLWDPFVRRGNALGASDEEEEEEEEAEEEESDTDQDDPDYIGSGEEEDVTGEESGSGESSGRPRQSEEEEEAEAQ
ncbi:hypothetical protein CBR_g46662 [Chara braunii]|uniref:Reverse transcriptase domain-containing protein n=1 Tax=Chara braunii TaxID=69332 RepID=A0A388M125_CHABU|nr:hypothetical protein CBR_g46662 [Chara braunii]|eukprot:GBG88173.1 hypothetical protein CBR_g46662 [Chara braunii]